MATSIDNNATDGNLDKFNVKLLNIAIIDTLTTFELDGSKSIRQIVTGYLS